MYNIEELNAKLLSELRPIADEFGIRDNAKFQKKELVYEILKKQSVMPGPDPVDVAVQAPPAVEAPRRGRHTSPHPRRRHDDTGRNQFGRNTAGRISERYTAAAC
jgi:transcription termination factor Rho